MECKRCCIICRELKNVSDFNIEHIIPEGIGNKSLKIYCVCTQCNSKLGEKVDKEITNNIISKLIKFTNNIKGKSKNVSIPFSNGMTENKEHVTLDKNLKIKFTHNIKLDEKNNLITGYTSSKNEAITIVNKKLKRLGKDPIDSKELDKFNFISEKVRPKVFFSEKIDFYKLNIEFIKIAYEVMYFIFEENYLKDTRGKYLSKIIKEYIYDDKKGNLNNLFIAKQDDESLKITQCIELIREDLFESKLMHSIIVFENENKIMAYINLFSNPLFEKVVLVGDGKYKIKKPIFIFINPSTGEMHNI